MFNTQPLGMRLLIQRDAKDMGEFKILIPQWIAAQLGEMLLLCYDGEKLTILPAERES